MGIKNLKKFIKEKAPLAIKEVKLTNYTGNYIAIDASILFYSFAVSGLDYNGENTHHLNGFLTKTISFIEKGLMPVYIFDGKSPELKYAEIEKRKKHREEIENKYEESEVKTTRMKSQLYYPKKEEITEIQTLLGLMGVPYFIAEGEAEALASRLCKNKIVYAVASQDMDCMPHGCPLLLKDVTGKDSPIEICYEKVVKSLGLSHKEFVDFCILCGCDYFETIPNIGPKKAYDYIVKYKSIEDIVRYLLDNNKNVPECYKNSELVQSVRDMFNPEIPEELLLNIKSKLKMSSPKTDEIKDMLMLKGFNGDRVDKLLSKINVKTEIQKSISFYFKKKK